ncbi:alpha-tubulin suppressor-like RCC1 family protein [Catenulispora sp. MAP5-51]|uniref:RCC1 domain-containing protein n=1 Tax=Catenulispora sp. MAP5-51 TaxID=3156298 RepID=UPI00351496A9
MKRGLRKVAGWSRCVSHPALLGLCSLAMLAASAVPAAADAASSPSSTVKYWGSFDDTSGISPAQTTPFPVYLPGPVKQIGTSNSAAYALLTDGSVYAWGLGSSGQLGNGGTSDSVDTAVKVDFPPGVKIASIPDDVDPYDEGLAIDTDGNVWGWGTNSFGDAFCLGTQAPQLVPVKLQFTDVTDVAGAAGHAIYLTHGHAVGCGANLFGELGDGTNTASSTPVAVQLPAGAKVTRLVAAWTNSGALLADGTYYNWGYNVEGELGQGTAGGSSNVPLKVTLPGRVREVFQGGSLPGNGQTVALLDRGDLYAWGDGSHYQLGTGTTDNQPSPVRVPLPDGLRFTKIAASGATSYGITRGGDVYAWGDNSLGQVGNGTQIAAPAPVYVVGGARDISGTNFDVAISLRPGYARNVEHPHRTAVPRGAVISDDRLQ